MTDDPNRSPVAALLGLTLALVLTVGNAAFYLLNQRHQRAAALALRAETEARMQQAVAREMEARARAELAAARTDAAARVPQIADAPPLPAENGDAIRAALESVLRSQQEAWNRGDGDGRCDGFSAAQPRHRLAVGASPRTKSSREFEAA